MITELPHLVTGMSWGADDRIVFSTALIDIGLWSVAAGGGDPELLTSPDAGTGERWHLWPQILPSGRAVLFTVHTGPTDQALTTQIAVLSLDSGEIRTLLPAGSHPHFLPTGHIVYAVSGALRAPIRYRTFGHRW